MKDPLDVRFEVKDSKGKSYAFEIGDRLAIREESINDNLANQPAWFARYGVLAAMAKAHREQLEYKLEEFEYNLDLKIREGADKDDKLTEGKIKALVRTDSKRMALVNEIVEAKEQEEIVAASRDAFSHQKDLLISLSAHLMAERETDLSIKKKRKE